MIIESIVRELVDKRAKVQRTNQYSNVVEVWDAIGRVTLYLHHDYKGELIVKWCNTSPSTKLRLDLDDPRSLDLLEQMLDEALPIN
jgi:hypothetical protein